MLTTAKAHKHACCCDVANPALEPEEHCYSKAAVALVAVESWATQQAENGAKGGKKRETKTNSELQNGPRRAQPCGVCLGEDGDH